MVMLLKLAVAPLCVVAHEEVNPTTSDGHTSP
jgi:hypothetical protein